MPLHLAVLASLTISLVGWGASSLTASGAIAATLVGSAILAGTGWEGGAVLATFFVGSSLVSQLSPDPAAARLDTKGSRRDAAQVLANGGTASLGALLESAFPGCGSWIVTVSLSAAAADTWATSLGALSPSPPRDLLSGRRVAPGTSGGVTWHGTAGGIAGATLVAATGAMAFGQALLLAVALPVGVAGMLLDSGLGSRFQGRFECPRCGTPCERPVHRCGTPAVHQGGWRWLTNDGVNAIATLVAGLGGWAAYWIGGLRD